MGVVGRLRTLTPRHAIVGALFLLSIVVSVGAFLELLEWGDLAECNPRRSVAHWTTLLALLVMLAGPVVVFMAARRSLVFAYLYLVGITHLVCYGIFWSCLAPAPDLLPNWPGRAVFLALSAVGSLPIPYLIRTSTPRNKKWSFLKGWPCIGISMVCAAVVVLTYHCFTLEEFRFIDGHSHRGWKKLEAGDVDGAITEFKTYLRYEPEDHHAYLWLGFAKEEERDFDGAIAEYTRGIEVAESNDEEFPEAYFNRGVLLQEAGDLEGSFRDYTEAILADESDGITSPRDSEFWIAPRAYQNRGGVRLRKGDFDGAATDFKKTLDLSTNAELVEKANNALKMIERRRSRMPKAAPEHDVW